MKPEQTFQAGPVRAAVWKNVSTKQGREGEYYSVTFGRNYKDKSGQWKSVTSFRTEDVPKVIAILGKAYEWCVMKKKEVPGGA